MACEKFETKMQKLNDIVEKLDDENISLDESISLYEDGLKLAKELQDKLKVFEKKIDELNKENKQ